MERSQAFEQTIEHFKMEIASIRTGRANPALVEQVRVKAYDSSMPLVQLASITTPDPKTIVIQPWDKSVMKDIERALVEADLGMSPVNDGTVLRLNIPMLTEERRGDYLKLLHQKLEQAKVAVRKIREDELRALRDAENDGKISENDLFAKQKELQREVDEHMKTIEDLGEKKEQEITTV